jgi:hypothetical protein
VIIEPESVRNLPTKEQSWVPPLAERTSQVVGAQVRILVLLDGEVYEHPWVEIEEVTAAGYVGSTVEDYERTIGKRIPRGTTIAFTADNIIEY